MPSARNLVAATLLLLALPAYAIERLGFSMENVAGEGWRASGLSWQLDLHGEASSQLLVDRLQLPAPLGEVRALRIDCPGLKVEQALVECTSGTASGQAPWLGGQKFSIDFRYEAATGALALKVSGVPVWGQQLDVHARYVDRWKINLTYVASALNLSDETGRYVSEGLGGRLAAELKRAEKAWQGTVKVSFTKGQAYVEPVFADFSETPLEASASLSWNALQGLRLSNGQLSQAGVVEAGFSLQWFEGQLQALQASGRGTQLARFYPLYVAPFFPGHALGDLQAAGQADFGLHWTAEGPQKARLALRDAAVEDRQSRYAMDGMNGELHWQQAGEAPTSSLRWAGAVAYKLLFGPAELKARFQGRDIRMLQPLQLPLLEGALVVREFAAQAVGSEAMAVQFDGELQPLDLEALTTALGWPRFGGQLSGRLPDLLYENGALTLGGALEAEVFDGKVAVENLRIQQPFGAVPQLFADLRLRDLDLEALTQAFSFGRIEGRLEGDVEKLQMLNWQPVAFDAVLRTPQDDPSRHRISQRAIENISALGGAGATAILSRGFMRFFKDFAYDRIGLSCRLRAGTCLMGGVGPSQDGQGYVLVKGRWLPRIDVIGYAREVDWSTLVEQLKSVTKGDGPVLR